MIEREEEIKDFCIIFPALNANRALRNGREAVLDLEDLGGFFKSAEAFEACYREKSGIKFTSFYFV